MLCEWHLIDMWSFFAKYVVYWGKMSVSQEHPACVGEEEEGCCCNFSRRLERLWSPSSRGGSSSCRTWWEAGDRQLYFTAINTGSSVMWRHTHTHTHRGTTISSLKPFGLVLWGHRLLFSAGFKMGSVDHLDLFRLSSVSVSWSSPVLWEILPSGLNGGTRDLRLTQCFTCNSRAE